MKYSVNFFFQHVLLSLFARVEVLKEMSVESKGGMQKGGGGEGGGRRSQ